MTFMWRGCFSDFQSRMAMITILKGLALLFLLCSTLSPKVFGQVINIPDCNAPGANDIACTEPTKALIYAAHAQGYPNYIGHAEPTMLFYSTAPASGNNMQWKVQLPSTDPNPNQ